LYLANYYSLSQSVSQSVIHIPAQQPFNQTVIT